MVSPIDMQRLMDALKTNKTIQYLDMSWMPIPHEIVQWIADMLKVNCTLKVLIMDRCSISQNGLQLITEALEHNFTLKTITLAYNLFRSHGAWYMYHLLEHNHTLRNIDIRGNLINPMGLKLISTAIACNGIVLRVDGIDDCNHCFGRNKNAKKHVKMTRRFMGNLRSFPHDLAQLIDVEIWSSRGDSAWWEI